MAAAFGAGGFATMGPAGVAMAALPFAAPPLARAVAGSPIMQRPNTYAPGATVSGLELLTRQPAAYAAAPAIGMPDQGLAQLLQRP